MSRRLQVSLGSQQILLWQDKELLTTYPVSTASNGPGNRFGSGCTPLGLHRIRLKIGEGCVENTVFVARRPTGEIYTPELAMRYPDRDWVLTRILWLTGMESGVNRGGSCDTLRRYIYIHGTAEESLLGQAVSHGCIRMANRDVLALFDAVENNTLVSIEE